MQGNDLCVMKFDDHAFVVVLSCMGNDFYDYDRMIYD